MTEIKLEWMAPEGKTAQNNQRIRREIRSSKRVARRVRTSSGIAALSSVINRRNQLKRLLARAIRERGIPAWMFEVHDLMQRMPNWSQTQASKGVLTLAHARAWYAMKRGGNV